MTTTKRKVSEDAVTDVRHDNDIGASESEAADVDAPPIERNDTRTSASQLIIASARDALNTGLDRLHPEVVQWGQALLGSMVMSAAPLKRTMKTQRVLASMGMGAITVGGILVALALTRDNQGKTTATRRARAN